MFEVNERSTLIRKAIILLPIVAKLLNIAVKISEKTPLAGTNCNKNYSCFKW